MKVTGGYVVSTSKTDDALRLISTASFDIWPQNQWERAEARKTSTYFNHLQPKAQPKKGILSVPYSPLKLLEKGTLATAYYYI